MSGKRKTNPGGSSNPLRADVLRVLGVLKVATADQIQRLCLPHLTYRHTDKATAAKRKEARTASHRAALADLRRHGLTLDGGTTAGGDTLRALTPLGLEAASFELGRPLDEMGGTARGAGRSGAPHAMAVNEAVIALIRPRPDLARLSGEPPEALAAAQLAAAGPAGMGTIASFATEVPLPSVGTWTTPGKGGVQADAVVVAPEAGVPVLFIEVDNCHMDPQLIAAKFDKYMRFFRRQVKDTDGRERAMWRTRWSSPPPRYGEPVHPPVLLVFNKAGARDPMSSMKATAQHCQQHWAGEWQGDHHTYDGKIPIVATTMELLREHGPAGEAFWRFGRPGWQCLTDAIGNPREDAATARHAAEAKRRAAEYRADRQRAEAEKARQEEARRPVCTGCGARFADARWKHVREMAQWAGAETYPQLCKTCKEHALEAERLQAEQERAAAVAPQRARGFLSRRRS